MTRTNAAKIPRSKEETGREAPRNVAPPFYFCLKIFTNQPFTEPAVTPLMMYLLRQM